MATFAAEMISFEAMIKYAQEIKLVVYFKKNSCDM